MTTRSGAKRSNSRAQNGGSPKSRQAAAESSPGKQQSKVTLYVRPDQVVAVEAIQLDERRRTGSRPDKSALVQEALDLLISKYRPKT